MKRRYLLMLAGSCTCSFLLTPSLNQADTQKNDRRRKWEAEVVKFEQADQLQPPPSGAVLFVGSSSIRLWKTLQQDFPYVQIINRGFGGSELEDVIYYADRIIIPYKPRLIVVYAGDNDLGSGKIARQVFQDYQTLVKKIQANLPQTPIAFISIKPSLRRWKLIDKIKAANGMIKNFSQQNNNLIYIDIFHAMLGADGTPRKELFVEDGLHVNQQGYALWKEIIEPFIK